jgi:hypothetical protein
MSKDWRDPLFQERETKKQARRESVKRYRRSLRDYEDRDESRRSQSCRRVLDDEQ